MLSYSGRYGIKLLCTRPQTANQLSGLLLRKTIIGSVIDWYIHINLKLETHGGRLESTCLHKVLGMGWKSCLQ